MKKLAILVLLLGVTAVNSAQNWITSNTKFTWVGASGLTYDVALTGTGIDLNTPTNANYFLTLNSINTNKILLLNKVITKNITSGKYQIWVRSVHPIHTSLWAKLPITYTKRQFFSIIAW